jgi:hypothetical protein
MGVLLIAGERFSFHRQMQLSRENATPQAHWRQTHKYRINKAARRANFNLSLTQSSPQSLLSLFQTDNI